MRVVAAVVCRTSPSSSCALSSRLTVLPRGTADVSARALVECVVATYARDYRRELRGCRLYCRGHAHERAVCRDHSDKVGPDIGRRIILPLTVLCLRCDSGPAVAATTALGLSRGIGEADLAVNTTQLTRPAARVGAGSFLDGAVMRFGEEVFSWIGFRVGGMY